MTRPADLRLHSKQILTDFKIAVAKKIFSLASLTASEAERAFA